jgi:hypothetical protein
MLGPRDDDLAACQSYFQDNEGANFTTIGLQEKMARKNGRLRNADTTRAAYA